MRIGGQEYNEKMFSVLTSSILWYGALVGSSNSLWSGKVDGKRGDDGYSGGSLISVHIVCHVQHHHF